MQQIIKEIIKYKKKLDEVIYDARNDRNAFREYVIRDDRTNQFIKQEQIHKEWVAHIQHCRDIKKHCGIIAPWGHGKTIQVAISESLYEIGLNQKIRIKIINASDAYAMDRIKTIKQYIENSQEYKEVFPEVKRDESQQWTDHRLYVQRDSNAIDPTIEARGITAKGIGGRADILIFDDPVDETSISSEKIRDTIRHKYQNLWMSRLVDDGFVMYICTRWHDEDLTKTIIESGRYSVLIQRVSEDFSCIEQEVLE